jgi:cytochrome c oxidase subunit 2
VDDVEKGSDGMSRWMAGKAAALGALAATLGSGVALADMPKRWEFGMQPSASEQMEWMHWFHDVLLMPIITLVTLFVLALLVYVSVKFSKKNNPVPSKTTHNTLIEVLWTVVPVVILVIIAIPSFKGLYYLDKTEKAEMTLKAIGKQWFWTYEYPDFDNFTFDANMVPENELKPGQPRLLEADNEVVLPIDTNIRLLMTAADVIHAWKVPSFGVLKDAVPGRINESWVKINRTGTFYGQCSEICGNGHAFMPIKVRAVTKEEFAIWVADARKKFARADEPEGQTRLADASSAR